MTLIHSPQDIATAWTHLRNGLGVVLYVGPDQIMPLTSVLGAILGLALMFWNRLVALAHKCRILFTRRPQVPEKRSAD